MTSAVTVDHTVDRKRADQHCEYVDVAVETTRTTHDDVVADLARLAGDLVVDGVLHSGSPDAPRATWTCRFASRSAATVSAGSLFKLCERLTAAGYRLVEPRPVRASAAAP